MTLRAPSRNASITLISWLIALALLGAFAAILRQAESARAAQANTGALSGMIEQRRGELEEISDSIKALREDLRKAVALRDRLGNTRRGNIDEVARLESEIARLEAEAARREATAAPTPQLTAAPRTVCVPSTEERSPPVCHVADSS